MPPTLACKVILAIATAAAIALSLLARAPARPVQARELRRLVVCALALYGCGAYASLTDNPTLAAALYAAGISTCALAAWVSRAGLPPEDPPDEGSPQDERPPPEPDGSGFDWPRFESELRAWSQRQGRPAPPREPVG